MSRSRARSLMLSSHLTLSLMDFEHHLRQREREKIPLSRRETRGGLRERQHVREREEEEERGREGGRENVFVS